MPDGSTEITVLIGQIEKHFAIMGWEPLLPIKINGLQSLTPVELRSAWKQVIAARDRMTAATAILEAIRPKTSDTSAGPALSDSAILRLRSQKPSE